MKKSVLCGAIAALGFSSPAPLVPARPALALEDAQLTIEYNAAEDEAALVLSAESETGLEQLVLRDPSGTLQLQFVRGDAATAAGLQALTLDLEEQGLSELCSSCPAGTWRLRAIDSDGALLLGTAELSHALPLEPAVLWPIPGALDVPTGSLTVSWAPDPAAFGHRIALEQGETDLLAAQLQAGSDSFQIPAGMLQPHTRYWIELAALGPQGNSTLVRVPFRTQ